MQDKLIRIVDLVESPHEKTRDEDGSQDEA